MKISYLLFLTTLTACLSKNEYFTIDILNHSNKVVEESYSGCAIRDSFLFFSLFNHTSHTIKIEQSKFYECATYEPESVFFFRQKNQEESGILHDNGALIADIAGDFELVTLKPNKEFVFAIKRNLFEDLFFKSPYILIRIRYVEALTNKENFIGILLYQNKDNPNKIEKADKKLLPIEFIEKNRVVD